MKEYFRGWDSGLNDAWDLAGEIVNLPASERDALFGWEDPKFIFRLFSAEEALSIMAAYQEEDTILICDECRSYIRNEVYWEINGEILCDDCAKAKYQRGVSGEYYEY